MTRFPTFDDVIVADKEGEQATSLQEQFSAIVTSARELVKTDRLKQELAMPKVPNIV